MGTSALLGSVCGLYQRSEQDLIETIPPHCTHPELTLALTGVKHHLLIN